MYTFFLVLNLYAYDYEIQPDTHPQICQTMRIKAEQICNGNKSCYTAQLSQFVDRYNSNLRWNDNSVDLFCNY